MNKIQNGRRQFASDNYAGICPEAWQAMAEANQGHSPGYGDDDYTRKAADMIRDVFETDCEIFFVFNGTAANSLALASLCQSYHSILCHEYAHVERDECGAPEFFSNGTKVLLVPGPNGKLTADGVEEMVKRRTDIHYPKPRAVTVTQATEMGTVYSIEELKAIGDRAKQLNLRVHMDGARFANAVVSQKVCPKELTWKVGVDVLCFGGTKNGLGVGDAVVFFNKELANEFDYRCKQAGQLASKMRFLAAPWVGLLQDNTWLKNANRANQMAEKMERALEKIPGLEILFPRQANSVFVQLPQKVITEMYAKGWKFYSFIGQGGCRLMCSWDTQDADIEEFASDLQQAMQR